MNYATWILVTYISRTARKSILGSRTSEGIDQHVRQFRTIGSINETSKVNMRLMRPADALINLCVCAYAQADQSLRWQNAIKQVHNDVANHDPGHE